MDIQGMLLELKEQRRALNRAINALQALHTRPRTRRNRRVTRRSSAATVESRGNSLIQRKNGTTGIVIPFSPAKKKG